MKRYQERILPILITLAGLSILIIAFASLRKTQTFTNANHTLQQIEFTTEELNRPLSWLLIPVILLVAAIFILIWEKRSALNNRRNDADNSNAISERKKAEEALRNSELRFRSVIEKGTEIIAMHDKTGK